MTQRRLRQLVLALSMLLALAVPALPQSAGGTVTGTVVDESGAPVPGANVQLTGPGANKFATTNNDGKYTFNGVPAGTHKVTVTLIGFSTETSDVTVAGAPVDVPSTTLKIALRGEEIVVTASKAESSLVNAPATMTVVSSETIQASPAQNYGDLLRSVPGLNVIQMSARDINMTSRQGTSTLSNSQLALLDGRSIYLDFFGLILWDFVPSNPADIKQIEVVRGPASAVWGANALTGVINIITKTPRESPGGQVALSAGMFEREADTGTNYGGSFTYAAAPNDRWSYRFAAGYFQSDAYDRPTGVIPLATHPLDASIRTGGATYPAYENQGTTQPKLDLRVDHELTSGGRFTYSGGYAGTEGIVHTGIGPFDLQSGSYLGYGRVAYNRGGFRAAAFVNALDGEAPNLLARDATGQPIQLNFKTKTYDVDAGYTHIVATRHILTYGGNARRNDFDITIAPNAEDRTELGLYLQDEIFWDKFRLTLGGRVDKFGNIEEPVFSPRLSAIYKPAPAHAFRASYNRAFRAPSTINNFLDVAIVQPVDLSAVVNAPSLAPLRPLLAPLLAPASTGGLFPLVIRAVGNQDLLEESLTAYEVGYTGTFANKTTFGIAFYINDTDNNINFIGSPRDPAFFYSATNLPPGLAPLQSIVVPVPGVGPVPLHLLLFDPRFNGPLAGRLPNTFTYLNIGKIRNKGVEVSLEHTFSRDWNGFVNYSWQDDPEPTEPVGSPDRYPTEEIGLPPQNRVNAGINFNNDKFFGSGSVNWTDSAFWTDVLTSSLHGATDAFTMVNGSFGVKWADGKVTTAIKANNILDQEIRQHIFGDVIRRSVIGEVRVKF